VRLLFDTHVALWSLEDPRSLSDALLDILSASRPPERFVSVASLWEIAIKVAKGKMKAPGNLPTLLVRRGFGILTVTAEHAWAIRGAGRRLRTADPFDRLIYAQAKAEGMVLATRDAKLLASDLDTVPA